MGISKTATDIFARVNIKGVIIMGGSIIAAPKIGFFNAKNLIAKVKEIAGDDRKIQQAEIDAYIPQGSGDQLNAERLLKYYILNPSNNAMNIELINEDGTPINDKISRMERDLEVLVDTDAQDIPTDFKLTGKYNSKGFPLVVIDNQFYQNFPADDIRRKPVFDVSYDGGQTTYTSLDVTKENPAAHPDITLNDEQGLYALVVANPSIIYFSKNGDTINFDIVNGSPARSFLEGTTVKQVESSSDMIDWKVHPGTVVTKSGDNFHASLNSTGTKMFFRALVTDDLNGVTFSAKLVLINP